MIGKQNNKNVAIFIALTIPATGKSTTFKVLRQQLTQFNVQIVSSDQIRNQKMLNLMNTDKSLLKKEAYQKTKQTADKQYFQQINRSLIRIQQSQKCGNFAIILDKNYAQPTLKPVIEQLHKIINKYNKLNIKIVGILPKCKQLLIINSNNQNEAVYQYPFSTCFIACCLKRIISRGQHPTLQGTKQYRVSVCLGWANNFRGFAIKKYFNEIIYIHFTKQQQLPKQIKNIIINILKQTKINTFDQHPKVKQLVQMLQNWKYQQIKAEQNVQEMRSIFTDLFTKIQRQ